MPVKIAPSILSCDFSRLGEQIREAEAAGADLIHVDVMDGRFVPNITIGPLIVEACRRSTELPLDVHLMIVEPERYIDAFAAAGATNITVHAEATPHVHRALQMIHDAGAGAGLAVNPLTPLEVLGEALPDLDLALVMSVNPGFGGQSFIRGALGRLAKLAEWRDELNPACTIEVDGGMNGSTAAGAVEAGAQILVAGSAIFNEQGSIARNLAELRVAAG
ncbi:MAG TPA: ribulose-phosphate 3-epimerase [Trueperaceae bacterium]